MPPKAQLETTIAISELARETITVHILGASPFICNRMAEKAKHELLLPGGRKTAATKQSTLKHDPLTEFRASPYRFRDPSAPTYISMTTMAFKGAMMTAALEIPGAKKAQIGRLVYIQGDYVPMYGVPRLFMAMVRSADINRTPDVRTRAILPYWATRLDVTFIKPALTAQGIFNLLSAGGEVAGVGDFRQEKGKGSYGRFRIVNEDDSEYQRVMREGGRAAQEAALAEPEPYDEDTEELSSYWEAEVVRRGRKPASEKTED